MCGVSTVRRCAQVCLGVRRCGCVGAGVRSCAQVRVGVRQCAWVCIGVHECAWVCNGVRGCVWKCLGVCECVCGMNFQNTYWRIESLHQWTLICILYEFSMIFDWKLCSCLFHILQSICIYLLVHSIYYLCHHFLSDTVKRWLVCWCWHSVQTENYITTFFFKVAQIAATWKYIVLL